MRWDDRAVQVSTGTYAQLSASPTVQTTLFHVLYHVKLNFI